MESINSEQLLTEDQLKQWSQYSRRSDLLDFLRANGILYFRGRGGSVLTTLKAVNDSLKSGEQSNKNYDW